MEKSLLNSLLGVNSLESITSLKELSEGKGRKSLVLILKEELNLKFKEELALNNLVSELMSDTNSNSLEPESPEEINESSDEKGVAFILNHIRKMKKAQRILKSAEVMALYKKTYGANKTTRFESKSTTGILVNKKQY
tara:strand:- start:15472 stop:15885 length:414 start_codon:yes stop_codon:yes gene_type:complete